MPFSKSIENCIAFDKWTYQTLVYHDKKQKTTPYTDYLVYFLVDIILYNNIQLYLILTNKRKGFTVKRYTYQRSIAFDLEMADKIKDIEKLFGLKFSEIVRECVEYDLPRLKQRHIKAKQRGQGRYRIVS